MIGNNGIGMFVIDVRGFDGEEDSGVEFNCGNSGDFGRLLDIAIC